MIERSPRTLVRLHGAGSGPWVFDEWADTGDTVLAPDLQEGLEVGTAWMSDYVAATKRACALLDSPHALVGWSMGGLVAMMAAPEVRLDALVLLEPSAPSETLGPAPSSVSDRTGTYDPADMYGFEDPRGRPESWPAWVERKRGISVPVLPAPDRRHLRRLAAALAWRAIAERHRCDQRHFAGFDHGDVVFRPEVRVAVRAWLEVASANQ
jgi:pimeloyl-ACP methyl ester carboxylesterase